MSRWTLLVLGLVACLLCLTAPAQAAGLDLSKFDLSTQVWVPLTDRGDTATTLGLQWFPFPDQLAPKTPTNLTEIVPWAQANLFILGGVELTGDEQWKFNGVGVGEKAEIFALFSNPVSAGVGYQDTAKWSVFMSLDLSQLFGF
jgi:hypothetical protein